MAVLYNHVEVAKLLLTVGAEVNARQGLPLILACRQGHIEMAELLLSYGGRPPHLLGQAIESSSQGWALCYC